jgi:hypothetical protein
MTARWRVDGSAGIWLVRGDAREEARALRGELVAREAAAARVDAWFPSGWGDEGTRTLAAIGRALMGGFPGEGVPEAAWLKGTLRRALLDGRVTAVRVGLEAPAWGGEEEEPVTAPPPDARRAKDWIEIVLVDDENNPVSGAEYEITLPDGSKLTGQTSAAGTIRLSDIDPGVCEFSFTKLDQKVWGLA